MTRFRFMAPFAAALLAAAALPGLAPAATPAPPAAPAAAPPAPPPPMSLDDGRAIVLAIQGAAAQGLAEPDPGANLAALASPDPAARAAADAALGAATIRFARDEHGGRINPQAVNSDWALRAPYDAAADFAQARTAGRIAAWVATLAPRDRGYLGLAAARDRYGAIVAQGGWPTVAQGKPLKPGAQDPRIPVLRARLLAEGYDVPAAAPPPPSATAPTPDAPDADTPAATAPAATAPAATTPAPATPASAAPAAPSAQAKEPAAASTDRLDPALDEALMLFQTRHGLKPDGVLTAATTAALNVPADERLAAIDLNLERARWMPNPLPADRIEVDTAATTAVLFQGGQPTLSMRAIVGSPTRRTPSLASKVVAVVFNPPWVVPSDIAARELYPKERRSPGYFARNSFSVIGGQLVQAAGPKSALGYVKFDIPTPFGVYLHDTPSRSLFQRDARWLSHGCMRLEKPRELAAALLAPQGWTPAAVDAAIAAKATTRYALTVQPPVFVVYRTATADTDGVASFRPDAYHWDAQLAAALSGR